MYVHQVYAHVSIPPELIFLVVLTFPLNEAFFDIAFPPWEQHAETQVLVVPQCEQHAETQLPTSSLARAI